MQVGKKWVNEWMCDGKEGETKQNQKDDGY